MRYFQNAKRTPQEYVSPINLNILDRTYNTLEQGHIKALELRNQLESAVANLDMDASEDEFKSKLVNDIGTAIDNSSFGGNMYYSLGEIIRQQGDIAKNPAIIGRLQANAARKQYIDSVSKMDVDDDIKAMAIELSPYYYEDKYDKNGNIIGCSQWNPGYTPVKQIDLSKKVEEWIKLASPDGYGGTSVTFMDENGNVSRDYTPGSQALVFSETTGRTKVLSPEKLMSAINFGLQNTPGAMDSIKQDMRVGMWKASKINDDTPEGLQAKIAASNGVLDSNGQIKSFNQYLMDRISPAIYAKQYSESYYNTKYHNDAIKAANDARQQREYAANSFYGGNGYAGGDIFNNLPYSQGPKYLAEDNSGGETIRNVSQLNQSIANDLRNIGVPEKELDGNLFQDINRIRTLINKYSPNSTDLLNDITRRIKFNGAEIRYYNQLQNQQGDEKSIQAVTYKSAIDGNVNPNDINYSKDNRFVNRYNKIINSYYKDSESIAYVNSPDRVDAILKLYGGGDVSAGEVKLRDAGFDVRTRVDGKKQIIIPKGVAYRINEIAPFVQQIDAGLFRRKGKLVRFDENGNDVDIIPNNIRDNNPGQRAYLTDLSRGLSRIYNRADANNKSAANKIYETSTANSPTATPLTAYYDALILGSNDSKTLNLNKNKKQQVIKILEDELTNLNFESSNYSIVDENNTIRKMTPSEKKQYQIKLNNAKQSGIKTSAENAYVNTRPYTGESYTGVKINLGDKVIDVILDEGRYAEEFYNLNNSMSRVNAARLVQTAYNNKPILIGFDDNNSYYIELNERYNNGTASYNITMDGTKLNINPLTADEAQYYMGIYQMLLEQAEDYQSSSSEERADYVKNFVPRIVQQLTPIYGANTENVIKNIIGF